MKIPKSKFIEIYNDEYLKGVSVSKLAKKYDLTKQYIYRWFYNLNLPLRSNQINSKKYHFNENYFESIDTPNKAYWLGFIYADGYIVSKRKHGNRKLGLSLNIQDINHLEKLNKCLESDVDIKHYQEKMGML